MGVQVFTDGEKWKVVWEKEDWEASKATYERLGLVVKKTKQPFGTRTEDELAYYQEPNGNELKNLIEEKRRVEHLDNFPTGYADDINASPLNNVAILRVMPKRKGKKYEAKFVTQEVSVDDVVRYIPLIKGAYELLVHSPAKANVKEKKRKGRVRE